MVTQEQNEILLADYEWRNLAVLPGSRPDLVVFASPSPLFVTAEWFGLTNEQADDISGFLAYFLSASRYLGLRDTFARIKSELTILGTEPDEAWTRAYLAWNVIINGLAATSVRFTTLLIAAREQDAELAEFLYPFSPIHLWALNEAARSFIKDLKPLSARVGGIPFGDVVKITAQATRVSELVEPQIEFFAEHRSPYLIIGTASDDASRNGNTA